MGLFVKHEDVFSERELIWSENRFSLGWHWDRFDAWHVIVLRVIVSKRVIKRCLFPSSGSVEHVNTHVRWMYWEFSTTSTATALNLNFDICHMEEFKASLFLFMQIFEIWKKAALGEKKTKQ